MNNGRIAAMREYINAALDVCDGDKRRAFQFLVDLLAYASGALRADLSSVETALTMIQTIRKALEEEQLS